MKIGVDRQARKDAVFRFKPWPYFFCYGFCKLSSDPAYPVVAEYLKNSPRPLLDIGCGMGLLAAYLRALGHASPIQGLDTDEEKITLANQAFAKDPCPTKFHAGDARFLPDFSGDVVVLDVLHYFDDAAQKQLLEDIAARVAVNGVALIRAGLQDHSWRYHITRVEEWFVKASRWIPVSGWNFPTADEVRAPFERAGFTVTIRPMWGMTPFNSYLFECRR